MARRIATGIDIGTYQTKVVVVEYVDGPEGSSVQIIGTGLAETQGMRHGYVVDLKDASDSVRVAKAQAEHMTGLPIKSAFLAIGGISLNEVRASGETVISRADQEVTELDIEKARDMAREVARPNFMNMMPVSGTSYLSAIPLKVTSKSSVA